MYIAVMFRNSNYKFNCKNDNLVSITIAVSVIAAIDVSSLSANGGKLIRSKIANIIAVRLSVPVVAAVDVHRGYVIACQRGGGDSGGEVANKIFGFLNHGVNLHKKGEWENAPKVQSC